MRAEYVANSPPIQFYKTVGAYSCCTATTASQQNGLKTYLTNAMRQRCLYVLMLLATYREETGNLNLIKIAEEFISGRENRSAFFKIKYMLY